jgi:hypothetical protein
MDFTLIVLGSYIGNNVGLVDGGEHGRGIGSSESLLADGNPKYHLVIIFTKFWVISAMG